MYVHTKGNMKDRDITPLTRWGTGSTSIDLSTTLGSVLYRLRHSVSESVVDVLNHLPVPSKSEYNGILAPGAKVVSADFHKESGAVSAA